MYLMSVPQQNKTKPGCHLKQSIWMAVFLVYKAIITESTAFSKGLRATEKSSLNILQ